MSVGGVIYLLLSLVFVFAFIRFIRDIDASLHNAMVDNRKCKEFAPTWIDIMYASEDDPNERIAIRHDLLDSEDGWKEAATRACKNRHSHPHAIQMMPIKYRIEEEHGFPQWRVITRWTEFI